MFISLTLVGFQFLGSLIRIYGQMEFISNNGVGVDEGAVYGNIAWPTGAVCWSEYHL